MLTDDDKAWITELVSQSEVRVQNKIEAVQTKIEETETRLLTEFHKWASPTDARFRTFKSPLHTLDLEFDALKDRVQKLDGGL